MPGVGYAGMGPRTCRRCTTLTLHWNGKAWRRVPSPNPSIGSVLYAVTAASVGNAWAVGYTPSLARSTLILHWNGKAWTRVPSPNPRPSQACRHLARSAWAVGYRQGGGTLILRWNGKAWKRCPARTPQPASSRT